MSLTLHWSLHSSLLVIVHLFHTHFENMTHFLYLSYSQFLIQFWSHNDISRLSHLKKSRSHGCYVSLFDVDLIRQSLAQNSSIPTDY